MCPGRGSPKRHQIIFVGQSNYATLRNLVNQKRLILGLLTFVSKICVDMQTTFLVSQVTSRLKTYFELMVESVLCLGQVLQFLSQYCEF